MQLSGRAYQETKDIPMPNNSHNIPAIQPAILLMSMFKCSKESLSIKTEKGSPYNITEVAEITSIQARFKVVVDN